MTKHPWPMAKTAICISLSVLVGLSWSRDCAADEGSKSPAFMSSKSWCADSGTICFKGNQAEYRKLIPGVRVVAEPKIGLLLQGGEDKLEIRAGELAASVGLELGVYQGAVALQTMFISPFEATYDQLSPSVAKFKPGYSAVPVEYGVAIGLSTLEGALAIGIASFGIDNRVFVDGKGPKREGGVYLNFQPISASRAAIKGRKAREEQG